MSTIIGMNRVSSPFSGLKSALSTWLLDDSQDIEVAKAQYESTRRQAPFLYIIRFICAWTIAFTQINYAPLWLVLIYPICTTVWSYCRIRRLWSAPKSPPRTLEALIVWRKRTQIIAALAPSIFTVWALVLFPYGTAFSQVQIFLAILVGNLSALFSLTHLRSIAVTNAVSSTGIYTLFFSWYGDPAYQLMALFGVAVTFFVALIEMNTYRDFISLIKTGTRFKEQSHNLEQKHRETKKLNALNYQLATTDHLTGVANKRFFRQELDRQLRAATASGERFGLCIFDIGGLKSITEIYGLDAGDQVLKEVARRLAGMEGEGVFVGRVGGDEFGLFGTCDPEKYQRVEAAFERLIEQPVETKQGRFRPNYSAGIAHSNGAVTCATELFERADFALSTARENRKETSVSYDACLDARRSRDTEILSALLDEETRDGLYLAFQPIIDIRSNSILGVECLARWHHPQLGHIAPVDFIPLAERSGVINQISLDLFEKALSQAKTWPESLRLSFNLSASNLSSRRFIVEFLRILQQSGIAPQRLSCEVTETSVMWDFKETRRALDTLKEAGVRISLDDFGTGYSSLSHVHRLPLDCIKIDRSFVSDLSPGSTGYGIVKSLLALSRDMAISCVVEGVETEEELSVLKDLGASFVQGYLFSKPLNAPELAQLLATGLPDRVATSIDGLPRAS